MFLWFQHVIPSFPARIDDMRSRFSALSGLASTLRMRTAVHSCHCPGDMAVPMRKVLTSRPWVGVKGCHLLLLMLYL